jgi:nucleoside 2-deoxyribosyltransferase
MNKNVYFAGSIRGGRADAALYQQIIQYIQRTDKVLTEHVGDLNLAAKEQGIKDRAIYDQDTAWLRESDLVIAECTCPSLGVGYELAYAERFHKPVYIFYRKSMSQLSAMLAGNTYYKIFPYETFADITDQLDKILDN